MPTRQRRPADPAGKPHRKGLPPVAGRPCELCGEPAHAWDHCHAHGTVRGALCRSCNAGQAGMDAGAGWRDGSVRIPRQRAAAAAAGREAYAEARAAGEDRAGALATARKVARGHLRAATDAFTAALTEYQQRCPQCVSGPPAPACAADAG